jgi:hypothetical protein
VKRGRKTLICCPDSEETLLTIRRIVPKKESRRKADTSSNVEWKQERPYLLVTSTSWTEDEDIGILLDALSLYDQKMDKKKNAKSIVLIITGKNEFKCNITFVRFL